MSNEDADKSDKKSSEIIAFIINKYDKITHADQEIIIYHKSEKFMNHANYVFRKVYHFSEYLILEVLCCCFLVSLSKYSVLLCWVYSLLFSIFYAIIDEYHQTFVARRSGQISDILIDSSGALLGSIIVFLIIKIINKKRVLN